MNAAPQEMRRNNSPIAVPLGHEQNQCSFRGRLNSGIACSLRTKGAECVVCATLLYGGHTCRQPGDECRQRQELLTLPFFDEEQDRELPAGWRSARRPGSGAGRAQASRLRPKKLHHTRELPVRGSRRKVGGTSRLTGSMARPFSRDRARLSCAAPLSPPGG